MGIYYTYPVLGDYPTKKVKQTIEFHLTYSHTTPIIRTVIIYFESSERCSGLFGAFFFFISCSGSEIE